MCHFHAVVSDSINFVEQPETQHVLIGNQINFTCRAEHATNVIWYVLLPNGTQVSNREFSSRMDLSLLTFLTSDAEIGTILIVDANRSWSNTTFYCNACYYSSSVASSTEATLIIHTSLRKLKEPTQRLVQVEQSPH